MYVSIVWYDSIKQDMICSGVLSCMAGEKARVVAMPTLEITADNIECSHGASVADLDENSMFYLAARGVSRMVVVWCILFFNATENVCMYVPLRTYVVLLES